MVSVFEKIKKSDLFFTLLLLTLVLTPILLKLFLTGSIGPTFNFYFFMVWIPVVTLSLAMLRGWQETALTGILIVIAILLSFVSYPLDPPMDFRRQIVNQSEVGIVVAVLLSIGLQITLRKWKIKNDH